MELVEAMDEKVENHKISVELRAVRADTFDAAELKRSHERPQSAINTTRALVKCFNKLLWFAAEVEDALNVKGMVLVTTIYRKK